MPRRRPEPSYRTVSRVLSGRRRPDDAPRPAPDDCETCGAGLGEGCQCHQDRVRPSW